MSSLPIPDHLPADLAERVTEYHRVASQHQAARGQLAALHNGTQAARLADAQALADAARSGADMQSVGTPAQDQLALDIRRKTTEVEGLAKLEEQVSGEVMTLMATSKDTAIELAREHARKLLKPYLAAIEAVGKAAREFDQTLYQLAGWQIYLESGGKRLGFGTGGSIGVNGAWLEPFNVDMLTASLREHSRRLELISKAIDKVQAPPPTAARRTREESFGEDATVWAA